MFTLLTLFLSSAQAQDQFKFVVVGDTQTDGGEQSVNWDVLTQVIEDMNTHDPLFGLFVGDLVGGAWSVPATVGQWGDFLNATANLTGDRLPVLGNHDVYGGDGTFDAFAQTFDWLPQDDSPAGEEGVTYYVDYGNTRIIGITSDQEVGPSYQVSSSAIAWLDGVLDASDDFEHVFVMTHHPVTFSNENSMGGTEGDFWQTLALYGVTGLFTGHWHRYQPSQPGSGTDTWETIIGTGGGYTGFDPIRDYQQMWGFLVVEVDGPSATASFYADADEDGSYDDLMDEFVLAWDTAEPSGLIARYTFEEGSVEDSAPAPLGRGIAGTLHGDASLQVDGPNGTALALDGNQDYVEAGAIDDYVLSINEDLTLSWWAQARSLDDASWPNVMLLYATNDYYTEDEQSNYSYWVNLEGDKTLRGFWEYGNGNNITVYSTEPAPIQLDAWHHYAMTRSSDTMQARFFVDGSPLGDPVAFDRLATGGGRGMLYLGADTVAYLGDSDFHGLLDEICIFDVVLADDQIAELSQSGTDCASVDVGTETTVPGGSGSTTDTDLPTTPPPDDSRTPDGQDPASAGCGCSTGGPGLAAWLGWPLLLLLGRRGRRQ